MRDEPTADGWDTTVEASDKVFITQTKMWSYGRTSIPGWRRCSTTPSRVPTSFVGLAGYNP
jgi:hypothetical protein